MAIKIFGSPVTKELIELITLKFGYVTAFVNGKYAVIR